VSAVDLPALEVWLRLGAFVVVLALMAAAETVAPRRARAVPRRMRWPANLGLAALGTVLVRALPALGAVGVAALGEVHGWGVLRAAAPVPAGLASALTVLLLDLAIYFQHVLFHAVPALWRLHRVHHADLDFDVTTGLRFHPLEILISAALKAAVVAALGPPVAAVILFEVLLNAGSLFNHANWRLPPAVDAALRWVVVTPDMHRVHHSIRTRETNSNFGFTLPWWDRLLGTYRAQPAAGHERMILGIAAFRDVRDLRLDRLLVQPFLVERSTPALPARRAVR
jgi:sterol desaturase/sphingolipid hydroxylase (fatty acid hydroxylase superfamily)